MNGGLQYSVFSGDAKQNLDTTVLGYSFSSTGCFDPTMNHTIYNLKNSYLKKNHIYYLRFLLAN